MNDAGKKIMRLLLAAAFAVCALVVASARADEPPLPAGLAGGEKTGSDEPALPGGLKEKKESEEPSLPGGLGQEKEEVALPAGLGAEQSGERAEAEKEAEAFELPFGLSGFFEMRVGARTQDDHYERALSLGELRLQIEIEKELSAGTFKLRADFLFDPAFDRHEIILEEGIGWLDLREANFLFSPTEWIDVKIGRQILTWGTGDLVFLNDLFPKDWNSFLLGRDLEYLKAPSDALKVTFYSDVANLDVVYVPRFDADRFIDGSRVSFYNGMLGRRSGRDAIVRTDQPDDWFDDDEIALRAFRSVGPYEVALYGYSGYWKSPAGVDRATGRSVFPRLSAYGASVRGPLGKGIGNAEFAFYDSREDRHGSNPFVRNGELRFLLGYEWELVKDFTAAVQYYLEHMLDHGEFVDSLPPGSPKADRNRHVATLRLTRRLWDQNLTLSLFTFFSPGDQDAYFIPSVNYKIDDHWSVEGGANVFLGKYEHTFYNQFARSSNVYFAVRYGF